jgi:inosine-uridine nucleoside N-ribohydrolase
MACRVSGELGGSAIEASGYARTMSRVRIHVDTDFAGDPDDACALAMILGWPDVEITGITTMANPDGLRAGCVRHFLELTGRPDIPVAVGTGHSLTTGSTHGHRTGSSPLLG